jgi:hypothetical protein
MSSKTQQFDTDARQDEYTTYAPPGETCPDCKMGIKPLESCRRIDASTAVRYRHLKCPTEPRPRKARS